MSTDNGNLGDVLFGASRGAVLALLFGHADQSFYTRQIARQVDASVGAVQRELQTLAKSGLIVRTPVGNQVFYRANRSSPVFSEMRSLISKTVGAFSVLRSAIQPLSKRIVAAFVYGSMARQEESAASDIDVMVIGQIRLEDVLARFSAAETATGRPINATVYSVAEFKSKLASGNHFVNTVLKGTKVFLLGGEDELGKVGRLRLVKAGSHKSR
jgi:uncharacterized protein